MNFPRSSRLAYSESPRPSCHRIFADRRGARGKCRDRRRADRASTAPEPEAPTPACRDACRCGRPRSTPAPRSASGSSFAQNVQNPSKRIGVHRVVDAHAAPRAKLDFDHPGLRSSSARHRARMSCRLGPRGRRRSDLNGQQNRTVSPARFRSSRLPSPCEEQALRNAVSPRHLAHHGPPASASLQRSETSRPCSNAVGARPREPSHPSLHDLKASSKVTPFATHALTARRSPPDGYNETRLLHFLEGVEGPQRSLDRRHRHGHCAL